MFSIVSQNDIGKSGDCSIIVYSLNPGGELVLRASGDTFTEVEKDQQGLKTLERNILTITKCLNIFISAVLMCEKYVVHNTVAGRGVLVHSVSVYSL